MRTTWFLLPAGEKGENRRKTGGDPFTGTRRQNVGLCLYRGSVIYGTAAFGEMKIAEIFTFYYLLPLMDEDDKHLSGTWEKHIR